MDKRSRFKGNVDQSLYVDFIQGMLAELDTTTSELNISRQAVIKTYLQQAIDKHYPAKSKVS